MSRTPELDAYIAKSPDFARPILEKLRRLFHQACPEIKETFKWSFPHFEYKGVLGNMAAFKQHVAFGFWKAKLLKDPDGLFTGEGAPMSRITDVSQLPADDVLLEHIREAVALNVAGVKVPKEKKPPKPKLEIPDDFRTALTMNKKARVAFEALSPSHQREYIEWITEAKQPATRDKRLTTSIEWIAEGKSRNWKYERKR